MGPGIPTLGTKIVLESNPLKCGILVLRRFAVHLGSYLIGRRHEPGRERVDRVCAVVACTLGPNLYIHMLRS